MKCALILLFLCGVAFAQRGEGQSLAEFINQEVHALIRESPHLTAAECFTACDADFAVHATALETETDTLCRQACDRAIHAVVG